MKFAAVDVRTGILQGYLPDLDIEQDLKLVIAEVETASFTLPLKSAPGNWLRLTKPLASVIVALDDSAGPGVRPTPIWGGVVQQRPRVGTASTLSIPTATIEFYLQRRYIRDHLQYPAAKWGVCRVGADLLTRYVLDGAAGRPGIPLRIVVLDEGAGRDLEWQDQDDKTVYEAFGEAGFEWTCSWEWNTSIGDGLQRITPVATLGTRIGQPALPGQMPRAQFYFPGNLTAGDEVEDWTDGKGANDVMLSSEGIGEVRPQSDHQLAPDFDGRPTIEHRDTAGTVSDKLAQLNAEAAADLALLQDGAVAATLTAQFGSTAPRYGDRWWLGDDIYYSLGGPVYPDNPSAVARAVGVTFNRATFSPVLAGE